MKCDLTNTSVATVLCGIILMLNCSVDANPTVHTYSLIFNGYEISNNSLGLFRVTVQTDGVYICVPSNTVGSGNGGNIIIVVVGKFSIIEVILIVTTCLLPDLYGNINGIILT